MTDHVDGSAQGAGHQEPREVRVAASHGHGEHEAAAGDAERGGHAADGGHGGHGGHESTLGPVDLPAWSVGVLGVAIGLAVALCFAFATGYIG